MVLKFLFQSLSNILLSKQNFQIFDVTKLKIWRNSELPTYRQAGFEKFLTSYSENLGIFS